MNHESFETLGLIEPIMKALREEGYERPTPIQAASIPPLLEGRDLLGTAQTGTGKTAAFALPILQRLSASGRKSAPKAVRALVVAPTRELAAQIDASFEAYGRGLRMSRACIFGGVGKEPQVRALARGVDILAATPGRLLDLHGEGKLSLASVEIVVLDEADRMLDMGFIHDVRRIVALLPKKRQTLLFSATMPADIASLAATILADPVRVAVSPEKPAVELIEQRVLYIEKDEKRAALAALIEAERVEKAIVFTRTKHGADRLAKALDASGIGAAAIHANKSQGNRTKTLDGFRAGGLRVLVATDIAARGIDVDGITHVFNFELPNEPETYVHRIGRTARAGASGSAVALCATEEKPLLKAIEKLIGLRVPTATGPAADAAHAAAAAYRKAPKAPSLGQRMGPSDLRDERPLRARPQSEARRDSRPRVERAETGRPSAPVERPSRPQRSSVPATGRPQARPAGQGAGRGQSRPAPETSRPMASRPAAGRDRPAHSPVSSSRPASPATGGSRPAGARTGARADVRTGGHGGSSTGAHAEGRRPSFFERLGLDRPRGAK